MSGETALDVVLVEIGTGAILGALDRVTCFGRVMSAQTATARYTAEQLESQGYRLPTPADGAQAAKAAIVARANQLQEHAAAGYHWPEAAAWVALEAQARGYLEGGTIGPDLAADCGDCEDPATVTARANEIIAKADAFRAARGGIVRWRRETHAAIDTALGNGATLASLAALVNGALAAVAGGPGNLA